jgi:transcriptional regulator with XRE-family HTH domain
MQNDKIFAMENIDNNILINFGKRVTFLRKESNVSQEKLAELAGLHRTYIGMIERGEKNITLKNIQKIAKALTIDIAELVKDING